MQSKKGQEEGFSTVTMLIIIVIGALILASIIFKENIFAAKLSKTASCYTSIIGTTLPRDDTTVNCPKTTYKVFSNDVKVIEDNKEQESNIVKDFAATDEKVNELFAKLLGNCLLIGGGVTSKAFQRSWATSSTVCLECYDIEFDREISKESFNGLREYLEKNNAPDKNKKYSEYFTKSELHRDDWINNGISNELMPGKYEAPIKKDEIYTIFFIGIKEGSTSALFHGRLIKREDTYFVYAATQDKLNKVCDRVVN